MFRLAVISLCAAVTACAAVPLSNPQVNGPLDMQNNRIINAEGLWFSSGPAFTADILQGLFSRTSIVILNITNNVTNIAHVDYVQIATNFPSLAQYSSLRFQSRLETERLMRGQSPTNGLWPQLDWSGVSAFQCNQKITLVTRRHGITCAHSPSGPGCEVVFRGSDGSLNTNWVESFQSTSNDLSVVTLSNEVPASVRPFAVLAPDFTNWFAGGNPGMTGPGGYVSDHPWEWLAFRSDAQRFTICGALNFSSYAVAYHVTNGVGNLPWFNPPPYFTGNAGGLTSSGDPVFCVVAGDPVFMFADFFGGPMGPHISWPSHFAFVQAVCGTNLQTVNLSRFTRYEP